MDRKFQSGAAGTPPSTPNTSTGYASDGDAGTGTPATIPGEWWFHMLTEEIRKVIVDGGLTPDATSVTQLSAAISALIASAGAADPGDLIRDITISANAVTLDLNLGRTFRIAFNANITTTTLQNIPTGGNGGKLGYFNIKLTADGSARTWAWLTSTVIWPGGVAPTFTTTNNKRDWFFVWTDDGGTTWYGRIIGQNF